MSEAIELYNDGQHKCLMFTDMGHGTGNVGVQSNQFAIINNNHACIVDPGGNQTYSDLTMELRKHTNMNLIETILASHADPDIIASVAKWMMHTNANLHISKLWEHFVPHFMTGTRTADRIVAIPDEGANIMLGRSVIQALPAHFLHSEGNFHFYDATSNILFTGDMGASIGKPNSAPVHTAKDFIGHLKYIEGFHRRYMVSNKVCKLWVEMVRYMGVSMLAPQHGCVYTGEAIGMFLEWIEKQQCGQDLLTQANYQRPEM